MAAQEAFKIGDKAVYPAHGVGEITDIQDASMDELMAVRGITPGIAEAIKSHLV